MSYRLGLALMDEQTIQDFWQNHACGDALVGGLEERFSGDYEQFFSDYDQFRYSLERHLPACFDALNLAGKRVLEIGLGQGADSESLIRRGAGWTGVDLTAESVERVRTRLKVRNLPFDDLQQGSVLDLPFADNTFDMVFSHGVLHHVPGLPTTTRTGRPITARWCTTGSASSGTSRRSGSPAPTRDSCMHHRCLGAAFRSSPRSFTRVS
jgi:SAM-dependent methyltransferase